MDKDINDRNYNNFVEIGNKPIKRVTLVDTVGNLVNPATSDNQTVPFTIPFNTGIQFINGLYLTITSAACNCLIMYE